MYWLNFILYSAVLFPAPSNPVIIFMYWLNFFYFFFIVNNFFRIVSLLALLIKSFSFSMFLGIHAVHSLISIKI